MPGQPLTDSDKATIARLANRGATTTAIARELGRSCSTIDSYVKRNRKTPYKKRVGNAVIVRDPSGTFSSGAEFTMLDLICMANIEAWAEGTEFRVGELRAEVKGRRVVREDRKVLKTYRGASYHWVEEME